MNRMENVFDNQIILTAAGVVLMIVIFLLRLPKAPDKESTIIIPASRVADGSHLSEALKNYWTGKSCRSEQLPDEADQFRVINDEEKVLAKVSVARDAAGKNYIVRLINCRFDHTLDLFYVLTEKFGIGELKHTGALK